MWSQDQKQLTRKNPLNDSSQTTLLLRFWANSRTMPRAVLSSACWKNYRNKRLRRSSLRVFPPRIQVVTSSYLFNRAASAVSLPTHSFPPISQPSDHVCLPSYPVSFPVTSNYATGPLPTLPENPSSGDNTLIMALEALGASDYAHSFSLVNEAFEQGISWELGRAEALNLRGTFKSVFSITLIFTRAEDYL